MKKRKGQGIVEYILMVGLIGLLVYGAIVAFGGKVQTALETTGAKVEAAANSESSTDS